MSEELSSKIAAGEVVERPASIVKELVENSLDAGATDILVELERGGKKSIRITDNGEGIDREDIPLAFERHATSKIYQFEDIYKIHSLGFRGEALPSIASISRVEMLTKRKESLSGTRMLIEGGKVEEIIEAGCPPGTSIFVNDIFYSTPARKKFLKKDSTEQAHCIDVIIRIALAHSGVRIRVLTDKRKSLNLPGTNNLSERLSLVFGDDFSDKILPVECVQGNIKLRGVLSRPAFTRSNTKGIFCYVNNRFIRDSLLNNAVMTSYRRLIEPKRFPFVVMFIELEPADVDVNVHPAKMEVRFESPWEIHKIIVNGLTSVLADVAPLSEVYDFYPADGKENGVKGYRERIRESLKTYTILSGNEKPFFKRVESDSTVTNTGEVKNLLGENITDRGKVSFSSLDYVAQIAGTYLAFIAPDGLVLMDQHAAHERVLFEKLKQVSPEKEDERQTLLIPEIINLSPSDYSLFVEYAETLRDVGLEWEYYGGNTVLVKSIPAILADIDLKTIIADIIEEVAKTGKSSGVEGIRDTIFTLLACKAAVKANHKLTESEVATLCKDLDSAPFASTCPHGRPLYVKFSIKDFERMFKRR
jgi:DNA mismatch repair protein MutL